MTKEMDGQESIKQIFMKMSEKISKQDNKKNY